MTWFLIGFIGWILLIAWRVATEGLPEDVRWYGWLNGFLFSVTLGPVAILFLIFLIYRRLYDKAKR
jgi:hypothetical protein